MNISKKINLIFCYLLNENYYSNFGITNKAMYWKIGTSIFNTFDRLSNNLKDIEINSHLEVKENKQIKTTQGNGKTFNLFINNINITPTIRKNKSVSSAAIHQYRSMINSFSLGIDIGEYKNKEDFVLNNGKIKLVSNFQSLIKKENRMSLIHKTIVDSLFNNIHDLRKISYSILIEILIAFNFDFSNLDKQNQKFEWTKIQGKYNDKRYKELSLVNNLEFIKKDIKYMGTIATYKEVIEEVKNTCKTLDDFINPIYEKFNNLINKRYIDCNLEENEYIIQKQIDKKNLVYMINNQRSKFKKNIFENRKSKGLIKKENEYYSDLVDEQNSQIGLIAKFNEAEAAHIYNFHQIKNIVLNKNDKNDNEIELISDPNNGLIMKTDYHKSFDRGLWSFGNEGNMIVHNENKNYLFNILQLKKVKIRKEVFNEKMKLNLLKRI